MRPPAADAFEPSRRLRGWMAAAILGSVLSLLLVAAGAVALLVLLARDHEYFRLVLAAIMLVAVPVTGYRAGRARDRRGHRAVTDADRARLDRASERLALLADTTATLTVREDALPVAWTEAGLRGPAEINVTTALLDALDDRELAAVVAHELAHVLHRDARVMTVFATPGVACLRGMRQLGFNYAAMVLWLLSPLMVLSLISARLLSRHRELAADRAAALLLGSGAALAAALQTLQGTHRALPDLRAAGARDVLHVLPLDAPPRFLPALRATHPPLERRIAELMRLEARLQR